MRCARGTPTPPRCASWPGPRARPCSTAAGIDHVSEAEDRARRGDILRIVPIDAASAGPGGSTWQSLARGLPVEVDYLNGEIVLLGRLHGVPTPGQRDAAARHPPAPSPSGTAPGSIPAADLLARL